jgi:hypothetical protein
VATHYELCDEADRPVVDRRLPYGDVYHLSALDLVAEELCEPWVLLRHLGIAPAKIEELARQERCGQGQIDGRLGRWLGGQ